MKNILKKLIPIICLIPFAVGTAGYLISGETATDSLYAAFALYFTNPVSDAYNGCVEFARWTAPLVTATAFLCILKNVWDSFCCRLKLLWRDDTVAVYSDEEVDVAFDEGSYAIYPGDKFKGYAKNHIIMFSSDWKSLQFYEEHREKLNKKKVYIGLKDMDLGLMGEAGEITLFDIKGSIARLLWKHIALWNSGKADFSIVVYGDSSLAQEILSAGLQLNLFSLEQHIKYHVVSENNYFEIKHYGMNLMNSDEIYYYKTNDMRIWDKISDADVVIIADRIKMELFQTVCAKALNADVYYYSPDEGDAAGYISLGNLIPFGRNTEVFTDNNIRRQKLIKKAIELNLHYAEKYGGEKEWNKLSGFLKASNISAADYGEVIAALWGKLSEDILAELEHTRWCRFHFLNYWKYDVPENGKNKDSVRRIHKDLVGYDRLDEKEKAKDREAIEISGKILQD
jgi:hypothetical protein